MGFLKKLKKGLNPLHAVKRVAQVSGKVATKTTRVVGKLAESEVRSIANTIRHPTLKGLGRAGLSVATYGASDLAFIAYDAKRYRDKTKARTGQLRTFTRGALAQTQSLRSMMSGMGAAPSPMMTPLTPINDNATHNTPSPLFAQLELSYGAPGTPESTEKPAPEDRGTAEDPKPVTSKAGVGGLLLFVVLGFLVSRGRTRA